MHYFLHEKRIHLQSVQEENDGRIIEKVGSGRIMIAFELDEIFITSIRIVQSLCVMWLDEIILLTSAEKRRNEALLDMSYRS